MPAILAPGPQGPIAREQFEILREGMQLAEAYGVVTRALDHKATRAALDSKTVQGCEEARALLESKDIRYLIRLYNTLGWNWYAQVRLKEVKRKLFAAAFKVERQAKK